MNKIESIVQETDIESVLPARCGTAIIEGIRNANASVPLDAMILFFYSRVAQVMMMNRVIIKSDTHITGDVYSNLYGMVFLSSSGGKDYVLDTILGSDFLEKVNSKYEARYNNAVTKYDLDVLNDAKTKFTTAAHQNAYRAAREAFAYDLDWGADATVSSMISHREQLKKFGFGGVFVKHDEFGDFFADQSVEAKSMRKLLKQGFEGSTPKIARQGARHKVAVRGVPMSVIFHTDEYEIINNKGMMESLIGFFNTGYARRMFVCATKPQKIEYASSGQEENSKRLSNKIKYREIKPIIQDYFLELYDANDTTGLGEYKYEYKFSDQADILLTEYDVYLHKYVEKNNGMRLHVEKEIANRMWKTIRLACLISAFEMPQERIIDASFVETAIVLAEHYGRSYIRFFENTDMTDFERLIDFLRSHKEGVSKTELRKSKIIKGDFDRLIDSVVANANESLVDDDIKIVVRTGKKNSQRYFLVGDSEALHEAEQRVKEFEENKLLKERE